MLFILNLHLKCRFFFACANFIMIFLRISFFLCNFAAQNQKHEYYAKDF